MNKKNIRIRFTKPKYLEGGGFSINFQSGRDISCGTVYCASLRIGNDNNYIPFICQTQLMYESTEEGEKTCSRFALTVNK